MTDTVRWIQDKLWVDRLEATIEAHTMTAAQGARELHDPRYIGAYRMVVPGQAVDEGGAACGGRTDGRSRAAHNADEVYEFANTVGFPLISSHAPGWCPPTRPVWTTRPSSTPRSAGSAKGADSIAVEKFVEGHEGFDAICVNGNVALDFVSHYFPNVLEAMRARWISPQFIATNRVDSVADYGELRELGARVNEALGIGTSATHMEWFFGPKGLRFSEIGCRPPGVGAWDLYSVGNDIDLYREWANGIVHDHIAARPSKSRHRHRGALRPDHDGHITGYSGVDDIQARSGEWVIDAHLPPPGTPTQPVEAGYMANAYVRMRHPDYDVLRGLLDDVGRTVHAYAQ